MYDENIFEYWVKTAEKGREVKTEEEMDHQTQDVAEMKMPSVMLPDILTIPTEKEMKQHLEGKEDGTSMDTPVKKNYAVGFR